MAGIAFSLRKVLSRGTYFSQLAACLYAAILSSGPWLTTAAVLAIMGNPTFCVGNTRVFLALISYAFPASLILVGTLQMFLSRYLADSLYRQDLDRFTPTFVAALLPLFAVEIAVGLPFVSSLPLPVDVKVMALAVFLSVGGIWLAMIFLSAARDFAGIIGGFAGGACLSGVAGLAASRVWGLLGQIGGFEAGLGLTFFVLMARVFAEFGYPYSLDFGFLRYIPKFWNLIIIGCAYNLGNWIDKILFWYSSSGIAIAGIHLAPIYDDAMFVAYLTIIPALALFLLVVEVNFYQEYRGFYRSIESRKSLSEITQAKQRAMRVIRDNLAVVIKFQGLLTLAAIFFAPELVQWLGLDFHELYILRFGIAGAFFQALHLCFLIFLLYFDDRGGALVLSLVFLFGNLIATLATQRLGFAWYGSGFLIANIATLFAGYGLLEHCLGRLEFVTFMRQPLAPAG